MPITISENMLFTIVYKTIHEAVKLTLDDMMILKFHYQNPCNVNLHYFT